MATPAAKLADALEKMQTAEVNGIVRSERLSRTFLTRLTQAGFLQEIIRGWYFVVNPASSLSGNTTWYSHYWEFLRQYLAERFGDDYCLLPEPSLRLLTGSTLIPRQLSVMRRTPGQQIVALCLDTTLLIYQERGKFPEYIVEMNGLRVMELSEALLRIPESYYRDNSEEAVIALRLLRDPTLLLAGLLENGRSQIAGRLIGAFRHIGDEETADRILRTMRSAGYDVRANNPFDKPLSNALSAVKTLSPYVPRIQGMWAAMRADVIAILPSAPGLPQDPAAYLTRIDEQYVQDAYHSLSIEGYRVTVELIEKIRAGEWNPTRNAQDKETGDALAARGYLEAFQLVKASVSEILQGADNAEVIRKAHHNWHQALFMSSVQAGLMTPATLAGYRREPVFIQGSRHVPLPSHALIDAMETLFELLAQEESAAVRAVLGHFVFVFVHPYSDGNGRMARFLMNAMLASGGYPWTIVHLKNRTRYMEALEQASVAGDIRPFAACIADEMGAD